MTPHEGLKNEARLYAESLREAADWFEAHPEWLPTWSRVMINLFPDNKAHLGVLARAFGRATKSGDDTWFKVTRACGKYVTIEGNVPREAACRKVVVGTREVPEQVVPERVIPAHEEEIVEWICDEPVLAAVPDADADS